MLLAICLMKSCGSTRNCWRHLNLLPWHKREWKGSLQRDGSLMEDGSCWSNYACNLNYSSSAISATFNSRLQIARDYEWTAGKCNEKLPEVWVDLMGDAYNFLFGNYDFHSRWEWVQTPAANRRTSSRGFYCQKSWLHVWQN